jgi:soluble lytic murein transglycosylase-like protein
MQNPQRQHHRFLPGIVVHHAKFWVSELYVFIALSALVIAFASIVALMALNIRSMHRNEGRIAALKADGIALANELAEMKEKTRLAEMLVVYTRQRVPARVMGPIVELVHKSSKQFGYDPLLVLAVITVESHFNPQAIGRFRSGNLSGAVGLMQLKPETAREVAGDLGIPIASDADLLLAENNVVIGIAYLTRLIAQFRSFKLGVLAYNQGPGVVWQTLSENKPLSIDYYNKVLRNYFALKKLNRISIQQAEGR